MGRSKQAGTDATGTVVIKKYANRRLYNTETSAYITLDNLAKMVRDGREFVVQDAKSGEDITHNVLTQIIVESESKGGSTMLPANFLRQIISMYGDSMQTMVPHYLEAAMDNFRKNQDQVRTALEGALVGNPLAEIAKRNFAMFEAATSAFRPTAAKAKDDEVADLKAQLAAMQAKIDKLG
jgi:polyhydroxyalkanoate synthesis repressor PhaR